MRGRLRQQILPGKLVSIAQTLFQMFLIIPCVELHSVRRTASRRNRNQTVGLSPPFFMGKFSLFGLWMSTRGVLIATRLWCRRLGGSFIRLHGA